MATTYKKRSITVPSRIDELVQDQVGPGGYSSYVTEALQLKLERDALRQAILDNREKNGPVNTTKVEQLLTWLSEE